MKRNNPPLCPFLISGCTFFLLAYFFFTAAWQLHAGSQCTTSGVQIRTAPAALRRLAWVPNQRPSPVFCWSVNDSESKAKYRSMWRSEKRTPSLKYLKMITYQRCGMGSFAVPQVMWCPIYARSVPPCCSINAWRAISSSAT